MSKQRPLAVVLLGAKHDGKEGRIIYDRTRMLGLEFHTIVWFREPSVEEAQRARSIIMRHRHHAEHFAEPYRKPILGGVTCYETALNWLPTFNSDQLRELVTEATARLLNPT